MCPRQSWLVRYALCGKWRSTILCPQIWGCIAFTSGQVATVHCLKQPDIWLNRPTECGASVYIWIWTNDQLSYESPHDTFEVAPFPLFPNLAAPKSPSNSMALSVHGILCGNFFYTVSTSLYVPHAVAVTRAVHVWRTLGTIWTTFKLCLTTRANSWCDQAYDMWSP